MGLLDYSAINSLLTQMDETKKRMGGGLTPSADAFQVPQQGAPPTPPQGPPMDRGQMQIAAENPQEQPAPPPPPMLAPAPPAPGLPVMQAPPPPPIPKHHGIRGILDTINNIGRPTLDPSTRTLIGNEAADKAESGGGLLGRSLTQLMGLGIWTPKVQAMARAQMATSAKDDLLTHQDDDRKRQSAITQQQETADIRAKYGPVFAAAKTPEETYKAFGLMTADMARRGLPLTEHMGTILKALEPNDTSKVVGEGAALIGPGGQVLYQGNGTQKNPLIHTFADGVKQSTDYGKTWVKIGDAPKNDTSSSEDYRRDRLANTEATAFARLSKDYTDAAPRIMNFMNALTEARKMNPAAYQTVLLNYANSEATTPGRGQLGILQYLALMDHSLGGRAGIFLDKLAKGTLPPKVLDNMEAHIRGKYDSFAQQFERMRKGRVSQSKFGDRLDSIIPRTEDVFPNAKIGEPGGKTMSKETFNSLSPAEQQEAKAAGYVVK